MSNTQTADELAELKAENARLLQENADLQLATAGVTMGSHGKCISLAVPVAPRDPDQYVTRHIDLNLDDRSARALAQVTEALDRQQARLKSGSRCIKTPDTIRWLCERLAEKLETPHDTTLS